jgi:hypothetical protein
LITTAVRNASVLPVEAVATTWATSSTLAPTQNPKPPPCKPATRAIIRQGDDGEAAAQRDERHGECDVFLVSVGERLHRPDRGGAADGEAGGDQQRQTV